jgi:hypothetical protein
MTEGKGVRYLFRMVPRIGCRMPQRGSDCKTPCGKEDDPEKVPDTFSSTDGLIGRRASPHEAGRSNGESWCPPPVMVKTRSGIA